MSKVSVIIPTYNASRFLDKLIPKLKQQTISFELLVIDSTSKDNTQEILEQEGIRVIKIPQEIFNHGSTRNLGLNYITGDIVIYLTQDALPVDNSCFEKLIQCFEDEKVALAYGRQLPYQDADVFGEFARLFNYPSENIMKDKASIPKMGIKTCFFSNSFGAYRKTVLENLGGFPDNVIFGEDFYTAAKAILNGHTICYCAEAQVYHSHNYSIWEEFRRYFDIGILHKRENWILKNFKGAESTGLNYIKEEFFFILGKNKYVLIPSYFIRNACKYIAYRLGKLENFLPIAIKRKLSMHRFYWH
ncbi:MAG: glycosyltransferase family 2 protein [Microscillaceae bacterium]|nr:glycosyltransferase family 2 protein [Microscillaceae bacterium]